MERIERDAPGLAQAHARTLGPLVQQWQRARREGLLALDVLVDDRGWTRAERDALRREISRGALELLQAVDDTELRALHDRHAEWPLPPPATAQERAADAGAEDEADHPWTNADRQRREAAAERRRRRRAQRASAPGGDPQGTAVAGAADDARRSVREVFRKLASALHPDRETDPARQAHKTALMQRANQAHASGDLLTLLELQREWTGSPADLGAAWTDDRLRGVNQALTAQLAALDREAAVQSARLAALYGWPEHLRPDLQQWDRWLAQQVQAHRAALAEQQDDMRMLRNRQAMKRWLKTRV